MSVKFHYRGHRVKPDMAERIPLRSLRLCGLCVKALFRLILAALLASSALTFLAIPQTEVYATQNQTRQPRPPVERIRYQIHLALDFENRTYVGTERLRWVNRG